MSASRSVELIPFTELPSEKKLRVARSSRRIHQGSLTPSTSGLRPTGEKREAAIFMRGRLSLLAAARLPPCSLSSDRSARLANWSGPLARNDEHPLICWVEWYGLSLALNENREEDGLIGRDRHGRRCSRRARIGTCAIRGVGLTDRQSNG